MGAYGIYIIVLTICFVIYFAVMIGLDLYHASNTKGATSTEVIKVGDGDVVPDDDAEEPTRIEGKDIFGGDNVPGSDVEDEEDVMTAEQIAAMETDELYQESMNGRDAMEKVIPRAQHEFSISAEKERIIEFYRNDMAEEAAKFYEQENEEDEE